MSAGGRRPVDRPALEGVHASASNSRNIHFVAGGGAQNRLHHPALIIAFVDGGVVFVQDGAVNEVSAGRWRPVNVVAEVVAGGLERLEASARDVVDRSLVLHGHAVSCRPAGAGELAKD